jgi:3-isopropylmalate dehydrogenase
MASRNIRLAVVPGDGIGPEVVAEGLKVLDALGLTIEQTVYELGAAYWHKTGEALPDATLEEIRGHDAILLGAVGDPSVPSGVLERGLLLKLRFELDHYINLRPVRLYPGVATPLAGVRPEDIDMMVVREGTEGPYAGAGGVLRKGTAQEIATQEFVHKNNVLVYAGDLWSRTVDAVAKEFPEIDVDYCHVDAATMFFVSQPQRFDVVVTDNLFGDIITDLGAAVAGGIGLAASGNLNPSGAAPSMFEPVHGSAPDIAGQAKADPTATILSVALLLDHLGLTNEARRVEQAVADDIIERQGAWAARSTQEAGDDIAERVTA